MNNIKAILNQINNIILLLDTTGKVQYVSPSVKNILGYSPDELLGDQWWYKTNSGADIKELKDLVLDQLERSVRLGGVQSERPVETSFGSSKWFLWNTSITNDGMIVSIGTDITEKKKKEVELALKNNLLSEKNDEIQDSLDYAKRLQEVILPDASVFQNAFSDAFLFFSPKDKVSGDFYWFYENDESIFVAAVDCTGHGVPGALLSVVGNSLLREIIIKREIKSPGKILAELDLGLTEAMSKNNELKARDGMDIALTKFIKETNELCFAGAYRPCILIKNEIQELVGSKYPIGFYITDEKVFDEVKIQLQKGDRFYLFSDGITDQFGGPDDKKFKKAQLKDLLLKSENMTMNEQKDYIQYVFKNWQQGNEQTDDVLLIGLEV
ncbi:MAG: SpoIIE family protein phosphatase [Flavobacteriales bacterium]|nr:SpoIIE family protein phosphatase [Flavobacteriales bacterium]